jgi:twitching motility protein PilI
MTSVNPSARETLTVMQQRLTDRLQMVKGAATEGAWLGVHIQGLNWLFPLPDTGEIFDAIAPIKLPHTKDWLIGVSPLRGALYAIIRLPHLIASTHPELLRHAKELSTPSHHDKPINAEDRRIVAMGASLEINAGFEIDQLLGIKHEQAFVEIEQWSVPAPNYLGSVYLDANRQRWQEVNLRSLSQNADFMNAAV